MCLNGEAGVWLGELLIGIFLKSDSLIKKKKKNRSTRKGIVFPCFHLLRIKNTWNDSSNAICALMEKTSERE